ncbi:MAG: hypothetical protein AAFU85_02460 [Planctomycetota bacterium]
MPKRIPSYRFFHRPPRRAVVPTSNTRRWVDPVRRRAATLGQLTDAALRDHANQFRESMRDPYRSTERGRVIESFALTEVALQRTTGMSYYDVQLIGGFVLAGGTIAEIPTGEGKTITTALPTVLRAWCGQGVHVATTNEYLSRRDHDQLAPLFRTLGLTSAHLEPSANVPQKKFAYACDITYGPGYEFGFDYLRDQMTHRGNVQEPLGHRFIYRLRGRAKREFSFIQRSHAYTILDEADSVLVDEASLPLILSRGASQAGTAKVMFEFAERIATSLQEELDYRIERRSRTIALTSRGWKTIHQSFLSRPPGQIARPWFRLIENALRARYLIRRDEDYVIVNDEIQIVDGNTGRIHDERTWNGGLHQAVQVKERVPVTPENDTGARITRQRFVGFYRGVAGLTGTATGAETEFAEFYGLPVVRIPTHRPCIRESLAMRCFSTEASKLKAIGDETSKRSQRGQPVLIGARTIHESSRISEQLESLKVQHVVLNGLQDESEAHLVARAGESAAVTVATNMAGRGTDIRPSDASLRAGGLHVIASGIHESARVDRQLEGRAARQGQPGSSQVFSSAEDELVVRHAPALADRMSSDAVKGECVRDFSSAHRRLQRELEAEASRRRQRMVSHDRWMESVQSSLARITA